MNVITYDHDENIAEIRKCQETNLLKIRSFASNVATADRNKTYTIIETNEFRFEAVAMDGEIEVLISNLGEIIDGSCLWRKIVVPKNTGPINTYHMVLSELIKFCGIDEV